MSEPPAELPVPEGMPAEASEAVPEAEMAQPVEPGPESHKRELEDKDMNEQKAKQQKIWMDKPSKPIISDCFMVWAEDKSLLSPEEILG